MLVLLISFLLLGLSALLVIYNKDYLFRLAGIKAQENVLYDSRGDKTGRALYYADTGISYREFAGVGVYKLDKNTQITNESGDVLLSVSENNIIDYIIGSFVEWEGIGNSKDRYLVLEDKLQTRDAQGEVTVFPKIRIGFAAENINDIDIYGTALGVEDLSLTIPKPQNTERVKIYPISLIGKLTENQLSKLIIKGDTLGVTVKIDTKNNTNLKDANGNLIASWVVIRRFKPADSLLKEAGIKITK
ncbi:MAG: hypothetical protein G01um10145_594 [Microgenomates group bacterium Gr01-1014_5]|nr:MAG: hypothetical protein G01um10145_594 [Microgenomates group bacterium Gr01-1014_5]